MFKTFPFQHQIAICYMYIYIYAIDVISPITISFLKQSCHIKETHFRGSGSRRAGHEVASLILFCWPNNLSWTLTILQTSTISKKISVAMLWPCINEIHIYIYVWYKIQSMHGNLTSWEEVYLEIKSILREGAFPQEQFWSWQRHQCWASRRDWRCPSWKSTRYQVMEFWTMEIKMIKIVYILFYKFGQNGLQWIPTMCIINLGKKDLIHCTLEGQKRPGFGGWFSTLWFPIFGLSLTITDPGDPWLENQETNTSGWSGNFSWSKCHVNL